MREPLAWVLRLEQRVPLARVRATLARAARGPADDAWQPPRWLLPHQGEAARRLAGSLSAFGGALCADAVGLGKTYTALAVASRYRRVLVVAPAVLGEQWTRRARHLGVEIRTVSHEGLSRGARVPEADLVIVDEAHGLRNPDTVRYQALAHGLGRARLLLLTATPVVNRAADFAALLHLFLADNQLALFGITSLEAASVGREYGAIALSAAPLLVARGPGVVAGALPIVEDGPVIRDPALEPALLARVIRGIAGLRFPAVGTHAAARLLALHLHHRFASSLEAGRDTLRRHRRYLDLALRAAARGESLTRRGAARLLSEEGGQLELEMLTAGARPALHAPRLQRECARVDALLALLSPGAPAPKLVRLAAVLADRAGSKTIVFTTALATARALARFLQWKELAVVSGAGARIASGRIPVAEALALFAPEARGLPPPPAGRHVSTLIATDLASEGLDLQDADAVVHYDLPWTPLRLEQRLGRAARLGSPHRRVRAVWFAPPVELDADLALTSRLDTKLATQLALGVPASGAVGRARVAGTALAWRERLAAAGGGAASGVAIVDGPKAAAFALRWSRSGVSVPEILVLAGPDRQPVREAGRAGLLLESLLASPETPGTVDVDGWLGALRAAVRSRLRAAESPAGDSLTRRLCRRLARRAAAASTARDHRLLAALDRAWEVLADGVRAGHLAALDAILRIRSPASRLERWEPRSDSPRAPPQVILEAALIGSGTAGTLSSSPLG